MCDPCVILTQSFYGQLRWWCECYKWLLELGRYPTINPASEEVVYYRISEEEFNSLGSYELYCHDLIRQTLLSLVSSLFSQHGLQRGSGESHYNQI